MADSALTFANTARQEFNKSQYEELDFNLQYYIQYFLSNTPSHRGHGFKLNIFIQQLIILDIFFTFLTFKN